MHKLRPIFLFLIFVYKKNVGGSGDDLNQLGAFSFNRSNSEKFSKIRFICLNISIFSHATIPVTFGRNLYIFLIFIVLI